MGNSGACVRYQLIYDDDDDDYRINSGPSE